MATAFRITAFGGISPRTSPRLLPDTLGQIANNVRLSSGEIEPLAAPSLIAAPAKPMPPLAMLLARTAGLAPAWFSWPVDVDAVRGPLSPDVESRFYWTGDGEPRYATFTRATQSGANDYPSHYWTLGVPAPLTAPTVSPSGGSGSAVSRLYCYTFFSELGEESAPSPPSAVITGKIDDTWAISGMDAIPPNSGDITAVSYSGNRVTITTSSNHYNRVGEEVTIAGVTTVSNVNGTWTLAAVDAAAKTMSFDVDTAPSGTYSNATDTSDTWTRASSWNTSGMKRRLYRSAGTNASFQLVDDNVSTSFNDTLSDSAILGDELISETWELPPVGLKGLCVHPSGSLVGFVNNSLRMCEPNQPHAWPPGYSWSTDYAIVAAAVFGSQIAVGTSGQPYVASGVDPAAMSLEKASVEYPCLSKRSMVSIGNGALYASADGLVMIGQAGSGLFTERFYTREEWKKLTPGSMFLASAGGIVYVAHQDESGNRQILAFDGQSPPTSASLACSSLYVDKATGELHLGTDSGIELFDINSAAPLSATWRSREYRLAKPINLGAAKVEFETAMSDDDVAAMAAAYAAAVAANAALLASGDIGGEIDRHTANTVTLNGSILPPVPDAAPDNSVSFTLYIKGDPVYSRRITSTKAFRLPPGIKYDSFSVEVTSHNKIQSLVVGETMASLALA